MSPLPRNRNKKILKGSSTLGIILTVSISLLAGYVIIDLKSKNLINITSLKPSSPPIGVGSKDYPLGRPQPETYSRNFKFVNLNKEGSAPIAWDPCRAIHFVINNKNQPEKGEEMIKEAVKEISYYSGFKFIFDGLTDEDFSENRESYQPERYGEVWAPILFTWSTPESHPGLPEGVLGEGGASILTRDGSSSIYVTGLVDLETEALKEYMTDKEGNSRVIAVILHELGHVMGLDHTDGPWEIMHPEANLQVTKLGLGDKSGLSILGSQPCHPEL